VGRRETTTEKKEKKGMEKAATKNPSTQYNQENKKTLKHSKYNNFKRFQSRGLTSQKGRGGSCQEPLRMTFGEIFINGGLGELVRGEAGWLEVVIGLGALGGGKSKGGVLSFRGKKKG